LCHRRYGPDSIKGMTLNHPRNGKGLTLVSRFGRISGSRISFWAILQNLVNINNQIYWILELPLCLCLSPFIFFRIFQAFCFSFLFLYLLFELSPPSRVFIKVIFDFFFHSGITGISDQSCLGLPALRVGVSFSPIRGNPIMSLAESNKRQFTAHKCDISVSIWEGVYVLGHKNSPPLKKLGSFRYEIVSKTLRPISSPDSIKRTVLLTPG